MTKKRKSFDERLDDALRNIVSSGAQTDFEAALRDLNRIVESIKKRYFGQSAHILLNAEPGFTTNIGMQMKVVVRIPKFRYRDVLFHAYIPQGGYPVGLDLGTEAPLPCGNRSELEDHIFEFVVLPDVNARMHQYRELAEQ